MFDSKIRKSVKIKDTLIGCGGRTVKDFLLSTRFSYGDEGVKVSKCNVGNFKSSLWRIRLFNKREMSGGMYLCIFLIIRELFIIMG